MQCCCRICNSVIVWNRWTTARSNPVSLLGLVRVSSDAPGPFGVVSAFEGIASDRRSERHNTRAGIPILWGARTSFSIAEKRRHNVRRTSCSLMVQLAR